MAKPLSLERLLVAKARYQFQWSWDGELPSSRIRTYPCGARKDEVLLRCPRCGQEAWVLWGDLRTGKSRGHVPCLKFPTATLLQSFQKKHQFTWYWLGDLPEMRARTYSRGDEVVEIKVKCGKCKKEKWVLWREIKKGRSKACRTCAKAPTPGEVMEHAIQIQSLYKPTGDWEIRGQKRFLLMECICGKRKWVSWNQFQAGTVRGCPKCASGKRICPEGRGPLYESWKLLRRRGRGIVVPEWDDFLNFKKWAEPLWSPGWRIIRIDLKLPYGPDNCDYIPISRKNVAPIKESGGLPIGMGNQP